MKVSYRNHIIVWVIITFFFLTQRLFGDAHYLVYFGASAVLSLLILLVHTNIVLMNQKAETIEPTDKQDA